MIKLKYVVESPDGIHARPAALLANSCVNYKSSVTLLCNGKKAEGNNVLSILALGANKGDEVEFVIDGEDEVKTEAMCCWLWLADLAVRKKLRLTKWLLIALRSWPMLSMVCTL